MHSINVSIEDNDMNNKFNAKIQNFNLNDYNNATI